VSSEQTKARPDRASACRYDAPCCACTHLRMQFGKGGHAVGIVRRAVGRSRSGGRGCGGRHAGGRVGAARQGKLCGQYHSRSHVSASPVLHGSLLLALRRRLHGERTNVGRWLGKVRSGSRPHAAKLVAHFKRIRSAPVGQPSSFPPSLLRRRAGRGVAFFAWRVEAAPFAAGFLPSVL
jgi:hypothetical protein